jgi:prevent-host-death family protein
MQWMSARDAKKGFGKLIDLARAEPVTIEKYGRSVMIVMAIEEYERLSGKIEKQCSGAIPAKGKGGGRKREDERTSRN